MRKYGLMHLLSESDLTCPLLASQVFDHAQQQALLKTDDSPIRVVVGIVLPMRQLWEKRIRAWIASLRNRCPDVSIRFIPGVSRLNQWPAQPLASRLRHRLFGRTPVVYHCRGEAACTWGLRLQSVFPTDGVLLDVRGAWPLELLSHRGVGGPESAKGKDLDDYHHAMRDLRNSVANADVVTTVSSALRDWLITEVGAADHTAVTPCCTMRIVDDLDRTAVRARWNIREGPVFLYSGSVRSYQHLDDLVLPLLRAVFEQSPHARAVFLTLHKKEMSELIQKAGLPDNRTVIESLPQHQVARAQTGADVGLLLKPPSSLGRLFQPVKLAEYLASGLPVVVEQGMGAVPTILQDAAAGLAIETAGRDSSQVASEAGRLLNWVARDGVAARASARRLASEEFLWSSVAARVRDLYSQALDRCKLR